MSAEAAPRPRSLREAIITYWPVALALLFFALLPVGRQMELPLSLFAFSLAFLATKPDRRQQIRAASKLILPLFLCIWVPMLVSSFDSLDPEKSWMQTGPSLRFLAAGLAIAVLLGNPRMLSVFQRLMCWMLLFWAADGYFQLAFGRDVFGVPMHPDRLNALFFDSYFSYGPTLAMLSPLALDHMRRRWRSAAWLLGFAFILGAVLLSGMRAAWVMMLVITGAFMLSLWRERGHRLQALILPVAAAVAFALAIIASPLLQERLRLTSLAGLGTEQAVDEASSYRLPIFRNALAMYLDHPVNGIGVRAMRTAYPAYADPDDPHIVVNPEKNRAHQAHNIILEFMVDTGTIGILGLLAAFALFWRTWRRLDPQKRRRGFPYAVSLLAIVFPLNSYFAIFGVYTMSITWVMVGLMTAAINSVAPEAGTERDSGNGDQGAQVGDGDNRHRQDEEDSNDVLGHGRHSDHST